MILLFRALTQENARPKSTAFGIKNNFFFLFSFCIYTRCNKVCRAESFQQKKRRGKGTKSPSSSQIEKKQLFSSFFIPFFHCYFLIFCLWKIAIGFSLKRRRRRRKTAWTCSFCGRTSKDIRPILYTRTTRFADFSPFAIDLLSTARKPPTGWGALDNSNRLQKERKKNGHQGERAR